MNRQPTPARARRRDLGRQLACTLGFNTLIAGFLWSIGFEVDFRTTLAFSQCMGLSIFAAVHLALGAAGRVKSDGHAVAADVAVGSGAGAVLGSTVTGVPLAPGGQLGLALKVVGFRLVFGAIISHFFSARERVAAAENALREVFARLAQAEELAEALLKLLQAQVGPHFPFNTLAGIRALTDTDPPRAREMVGRLSGCLRNCLDQMRADTITLRDERGLVEEFRGHPPHPHGRAPPGCHRPARRTHTRRTDPRGSAPSWWSRSMTDPRAVIAEDEQHLLAGC